MRKVLAGVAAVLALGLFTAGISAEAEPKTYAATEIEYTAAEVIKPAVSEEVKAIKKAEEEAKTPEYFYMDMGEYEITAYCGCTTCASGTGYTAIGTIATEGRTIGVDPRIIKLGATVLIEFENGLKREYVAEDTGSAIKGNIIDLYFDSHQDALNFGRQHCHVYTKELNDPRN